MTTNYIVKASAAVILVGYSFSAFSATNEPVSATTPDTATAAAPAATDFLATEVYTNCDKFGAEWCKEQGESLSSYARKVAAVRKTYAAAELKTWRASNSAASTTLNGDVKTLRGTLTSDIETKYTTAGAPTVTSLFSAK